MSKTSVVTPVIQRHVAKNKRGYVAYEDGHGKIKPVYYFLPHSVKASPRMELWPKHTRDWAESWRPLLIDEAKLGPKLEGEKRIYKLAEDVVLKDDEGYLSASHFAVIPRKVGEEEKYHVVWGREEDGKPPWYLWRLYVHADDKEFDAYSMKREDRPPGFVVPIWMAAESTSPFGAPEPANEQRLKENLTPPEDSWTGGP